MTRDEIREIADIVGGDKTYKHFVHRINKEFDLSDEVRNSRVYVIFSEDQNQERNGFAVVGSSPTKMKAWEEAFKEESWVPKSFKINGVETFELMYIYIKPKDRNKGYGGKILKKS